MIIFEMLGLAFVCTLVVMTVLWLFYFFYRNETLLEIGAAVNCMAIALIYFFMGEGFLLRRAVIMSMAIIWAARLVTALIARAVRGTSRGHRHPFAITFNMDSSGVSFLLFIVQGLLMIVLSIPFLPAVQNPSQAVSGWEAAGALVWLFAIWCETLTEKQLQEFEKDPAHLGEVPNVGFWSHMRRPDLFFAWCVWVSFALFAMGSPWGWVGWVSPIVVLLIPRVKRV
jgi:steroid 5-alpha reductase family enzyme